MSITALRLLILGLLIGGMVGAAFAGELTTRYVITRILACASLLLVVELGRVWQLRRGRGARR